MPTPKLIDITKDALIPVSSSKEGVTSVSSITGKKPETITRWIKGGTKRVLAGVKIGGSWYTTHRALEEFMCGCNANVAGSRSNEGYQRAVASLQSRMLSNAGKSVESQSRARKLCSK